MADLFRRGLAIAIPLYLFGVLIQIENARVVDVTNLLQVVTNQAPFVGLALSLGLLGAWASVRPRWRWLFLSVTVCYLLLLIADQLSFSVYGGHLTPSLWWQQNDLRHLRSSLLAVLNFSFAVNTLCGVGVLLWCRLKTTAHQLAEGSPSPNAILILALVIAASSLTVATGAAPVDPTAHPLAQIITKTMHRNHAPDVSSAPVESLYSLRFGTAREKDEADVRLEQLGREFADRKKRPNIVLLVLESVGSKQLQQPDIFGPHTTPNLYSFFQQGVLFDTIYTTLPGSENANVNMMTGGYAPTWQDVAELTEHPFKGPMLGRLLQQAGYRTATFASADLSYRNLRPFFLQGGYDGIVDFGSLPEPEKKAIRLNSWGAQDHLIMEKAIRWVLETPGEQPFFLHFLTNAPHHPFDVPAQFETPYQSGGAENAYRNALAYIDATIGQLVRALQQNSRFEETLIMVTGDHGEPLADDSQSHIRSRNYLYQNAVKSFLLLRLPGVASQAAVRTQRTGTHGDILPTLLSLVGIQGVETAGQNLLGSDYRERITYFNSSNQPGEWGLLDGEWKFMASGSSGGAELYHLGSDPEERINLAENRGEQIAVYQQLCANWFIQHNEKFVSRLTGTSVAASPTMSANITAGGIYSVSAGYLSSAAGELVFEAQTQLHPMATVIFKTPWLPFAETRHLTYEWRSPTGDIYTLPVPVVRRSIAPLIALHAPKPLAKGVWQLRIRDESQPAPLVDNFEFEVSDAARVASPIEQVQPLLGMRVAPSSQAPNPRPADGSQKNRVALQLRWQPVHLSRNYTLRFKLPDGSTYQQMLPQRSVGQVNQIVPLNISQSAPRGTWYVELYFNSERLYTTQFEVD